MAIPTWSGDTGIKYLIDKADGKLYAAWDEAVDGSGGDVTYHLYISDAALAEDLFVEENLKLKTENLQEIICTMADGETPIPLYTVIRVGVRASDADGNADDNTEEKIIQLGFQESYAITYMPNFRFFLHNRRIPQEAIFSMQVGVTDLNQIFPSLPNGAGRIFDRNYNVAKEWESCTVDGMDLFHPIDATTLTPGYYYLKVRIGIDDTRTVVSDYLGFEVLA